MSDLPSLDEIRRAQRRNVVLGVLAAAVVLLLVLLATVHEPLMVFLEGVAHGDHDLLGRATWEAPHPVAPGDLAGVDLAAVHAELIPAWMIAQDRGGERATAAARALREGVAADPNLAALVDELTTLVAQDPAGQTERIHALLDGWNAYLGALGEPWRLEGHVRRGEHGVFFYTKSYHVEAALSATAGEVVAPLLLLRRVDHTNVVEGYLGLVRAGEPEALVVVDRARDFALEELWPLLDPAGVEPFAPGVASEAAAALSEGDLAALVATAPARRAGLIAVAHIQARNACGSPVLLADLPWFGLDQDSLAFLEQAVGAFASPTCPGVLPAELDALRAATESSRATPGLEAALEALAAWAARGTAIHEARHAVDGALFGAAASPHADGLPLSGAAVDELSAYLASFAWSDARFAALQQACAQTDGPHGRAMAWIDHALDGACAAPPADLAARAQALERAVFGTRDPVVLPAEWPARLPLR
ncbi:MAG: hypothetical protein ABIO70_36485 [Pseudomonadota bacterium]